MPDAEDVGVAALRAEGAQVGGAHEPPPAPANALHLLRFVLLDGAHGVRPVGVDVRHALGAVVDRDERVSVGVLLGSVGVRAEEGLLGAEDVRHQGS